MAKPEDVVTFWGKTFIAEGALDDLALPFKPVLHETGNFAGVKRRAGGAAWGGTSKAREDRAFETRLAIGLGVRR
jgi:hypothetical protein